MKFQNDMAERLWYQGVADDEAFDEPWCASWAIGFDDENAGWYIISEDEQGFVDLEVYGFGADNEAAARARWQRILSIVDYSAPVYHD